MNIEALSAKALRAFCDLLTRRGGGMADAGADDSDGKVESEIFRLFMHESERAIVVLGVAKLDADLEEILKRVFRPVGGKRDPLFDPGEALSSFGTKIQLAERLGVIEKDFATVLQTLRKIRNDFAHNATDPKLSLANHRERVEQIAKWAAEDRSYGLVMYVYAEPASFPDLRLKFIASMTTIMLLFSAAKRTAKRIDAGLPIARTGPPFDVAKFLESKT
ncbi:hypothetical protein [Burkholderia vietnamiensis]|uniref:hypothetical protein n=1 Tax=Burkholderia vietnamiensis TaxID=60552 RepID=UPI001CC3D1A3|nr:hypothetical protein [Burkholderia vietnamiensis]